MAVVKGMNRTRLEKYLAGADEDQMRLAGQDWRRKAAALKALATALETAAQDAELTIGSDTLTGPALRASMSDTSVSITHKATQLEAAGAELVEVAGRLTTARSAVEGMKPLSDQPSPYTPPAGTPGVPFTEQELATQAADRQARNDERASWQADFDAQEAQAAVQVTRLDEKFLEAIPPMQAIHGQDDPTAPPTPPPGSPSGPGFPSTAPPTGPGGTTNGGTTNGGGNGSGGTFHHVEPPTEGPIGEPPTPQTEPPVISTCEFGPFDPPVTTPHPTVSTHPPTTTVGGSPQAGIDYQPGTSGLSGGSGSPVSVPGSTSGAGALGAAGLAAGAGALGAGRGGAAGGIRGGVSATGSPTRGATSGVRGIGSTGRAAGPSSLSSSAGSRGAASAGSPTTRAGTSGTGSAGGRAAAAGATGRAGGAGGRGTGAGAGGRGVVAGAGGRGTGAGAGGRGTGAGAGGRGMGAGAAQGSRRSDRKDADRDSLVYDQDWLGDEDIAPGVLD